MEVRHTLYDSTFDVVLEKLTISSSVEAITNLHIALNKVLEKKPAHIIAKSNKTLACHSGCAHCCYLRVHIFAFEAILIHDYINHSVSKRDRKQIIDNIKINASTISSMTSEEHLLTNIKCPMLIKEKCIIYPARPLACNQYHSIEIEDCNMSFMRPTDKSLTIRVIPELKQFYDITIKAISEAYTKSGHDNSRNELSTSLVKIFENPSLVEKWHQGEIIF
ncbi:MAG: YkgJ family cysteine cluster protein [Gammaproteobacteria bacterium]|nr:YkgJ family cysteine cluster protein [Gammaproteobacteria bacterium]